MDKSENNRIKIGIPSMDSKGLSSIINGRFGRTQFFTIVDLKNKNIESVKVIENPGCEALGGAGPLAAEQLIKEKVNVIIGEKLGFNATNALSNQNIKIFKILATNANISVNDAILRFIEGKLDPIEI